MHRLLPQGEEGLTQLRSALAARGAAAACGVAVSLSATGGWLRVCVCDGCVLWWSRTLIATQLSGTIPSALGALQGLTVL